MKKGYNYIKNKEIIAMDFREFKIGFAVGCAVFGALALTLIIIFFISGESFKSLIFISIIKKSLLFSAIICTFPLKISGCEGSKYAC